jgi:hypothetical protein
MTEWCFGKAWLLKKEGSLPRPAARATPVVAAIAQRESGRPWTTHSPASQPTRVFLILPDHSFLSEPSLSFSVSLCLTNHDIQLSEILLDEGRSPRVRKKREPFLNAKKSKVPAPNDVIHLSVN